jgi:hypothetical protein
MFDSISVFKDLVFEAGKISKKALEATCPAHAKKRLADELLTAGPQIVYCLFDRLIHTTNQFRMVE